MLLNCLHLAFNLQLSFLHNNYLQVALTARLRTAFITTMHTTNNLRFLKANTEGAPKSIHPHQLLITH